MTDLVPEDMPRGVGEFIGYAAMRGITLPLDFCQWLVAAPMPLTCEQCIAVLVCFRSIVPTDTKWQMEAR